MVQRGRFQGRSGASLDRGTRCGVRRLLQPLDDARRALAAPLRWWGACLLTRATTPATGEAAWFELAWWFIHGRSSARQCGSLHVARAAASLAPPAAVEWHLLWSVVVDGISGGGWTVLLGSGWLRWMSTWLRQVFLGLQLMRLIVVWSR
jgi:hypothetical protein